MTANDILHALLRANLAAGAAILIVVALRKPVRKITGARLAYALWLLPLLATIAVVLPARQIIVTLPPLAAQTASAVELIAASGMAAPSVHLDPHILILTLWLTGAVASALVMAALQWRFHQAAAQGAVGPAVVGVLRPRIITPPSFHEIFDATERALVLAHEEAHIARQDSRINGLSVLFQCLFWFNPLIHLAAHLARIDQEMACDEAVITRFPGARQTYARALVKAQLATRPLPLGCCWPSGTEHPLEERIAMLKSKPKSRARRLVAGSALAGLCAATGLAAWAAQPASVALVHAVAVSQPPAVAPNPVQTVAYKSAQQVKPAPANAPPPAPAQVCVTNACMTKDKNARAITDAVARGDYKAVVALGGGGKDVVRALIASGWMPIDHTGEPGWDPQTPEQRNVLPRLLQMSDVQIVQAPSGGAGLSGTNPDGSGRMMFLPSADFLGPAPAGAPRICLPGLNTCPSQ